MKRELRFLQTEVRVQKEADKPTVITGYAAVFNAVTKIGGSFSEVIRPGAFTRALKEKQDARALFNHNDNKVLGRVKSGTLRLAIDDKGLRYEIDAPNTTVGNDLVESINRGDIDASSFGFIARGQKWNEETKDGKTTYLRELTDVDLLDVSPVTYPAYSSTSVGIRSEILDALDAPKEIRAALADSSLECGCDCTECTDGSCSDCSNTDCADENCSCKQQSETKSAEEFKQRAELRLRLAEKA